MTGFCGAVTTDGELRLARFNAVSGPVSFNPSIIVIPAPLTPNVFCILGSPCNIPTLRITSDPSCATGADVAVICGVRGSDSALYVSQFNGTTFSSFQSEGGVLAGAPSCSFGVCAVRDANSLLYTIQISSSGNSGFTPVPATTDINGDPSCASYPFDGTILTACGAKSTNSTLWETIGH
jgi:hypothetical protein